MAIARHKTRQRELREARALVRRVQRGDPGAFELLYATYEGRIYRFCHRLTGREETAAALVELTFARALADLPEGPLDKLDVPAHLHATARALAFERNGEPLGSRGAAEGEVAVANDRLPPLERAALALRDLEGRPDDEIAAALGLEEAAVPGLVGTARLHLLAELRPAGIAEPCPGRLPDLSAYSDGTLAPERRLELEAHVNACAACRATLFALREAALRYKALPTPDPPGELGSRIGRALGLVGLPARRSEAVEPVATGGRQTAAAVAMAALAVVGVGVTIAASHADHDNSKPTRAPAPAPSQPEAQPSAPASGSPLASRVVSLAAAKKLRPPPALHHVRAGARRMAPARTPPPNPVLQGLGKSFAPESPPRPAPPPAAPSRGTRVTRPKPQRKIPVQIVPPVTPSHAQAAANEPSPPPNPPPAPAPPPPQTTTT
ncbi:MAG: zf-HC2 domain-containing protein [Actinomycetota bacterium]|nr:zf-HC2 domain-containing protein [Actinomycetota bacterium]